MHIPNFRAGDTVNYSVFLKDYPNDVWTLIYYFRGPSSLDAIASPGNTLKDYDLLLTSSQTSLLTPGRYWWESKVSNGTEKYTISNNQVEVLVDLSTVLSNYDGRSPNEILLAQVNDAISKLTSGAVQQYTIHERQMTYVDLDDLIKWRDQLRIEVNREQFPDRRIVQSRF